MPEKSYKKKHDKWKVLILTYRVFSSKVLGTHHYILCMCDLRISG